MTKHEMSRQFRLPRSAEVDCGVLACVADLAVGASGIDPEVFHSDQGCQYTARDFTVVQEGRKVAISMSGRGRAYDSIFVERFWRSLKYEEIYKHEYASVDELRRAAADYIHHYNTERPHQALDYHTPWEIYTNRLDAAESKGNTGIQTWGSQEPLSAPPTN